MKLKIKSDAVPPFAIALVSGLMASTIIYTSGFEHPSSFMFSGLALVSALAGVFVLSRKDGGSELSSMHPSSERNQMPIDGGKGMQGLEEVCCGRCGMHICWMIYAGPTGTHFCDCCAEHEADDDE